MTQIPSLIHGFAIAPDGTATPLNWADVKARPLRDGRFSWIHLDRTSPEVGAWLRGKSGLTEIETSIMLEDDTRPRCVRQGDALLLNLRGINLNPDLGTPEDMISLRFYVHEDTILTMRGRPVKAVQDLVAEIHSGHAPPSPGGIVNYLTERLIARIDTVIDSMEDEAAALEDQMLEPHGTVPKTVIANFRRRVLRLRRYIIPQREALANLVREADAGFTEDDKLQLRETANQITRIAEDLDTVRERLTVLQEQLVEQRAEAMNDRLFVLAIISAIFLPLGFLTGLFGINVGGMPMVDDAFGFWAIVISCLMLTAGLFAIFRWQRWI